MNFKAVGIGLMAVASFSFSVLSRADDTGDLSTGAVVTTRGSGGSVRASYQHVRKNQITHDPMDTMYLDLHGEIGYVGSETQGEKGKLIGSLGFTFSRPYDEDLPKRIIIGDREIIKATPGYLDVNLPSILSTFLPVCPIAGCVIVADEDGQVELTPVWVGLLADRETGVAGGRTGLKLYGEHQIDGGISVNGSVNGGVTWGGAGDNVKQAGAGYFTEVGLGAKYQLNENWGLALDATVATNLAKLTRSEAAEGPRQSTSVTSMSGVGLRAIGAF